MGKKTTKKPATKKRKKCKHVLGWSEWSLVWIVIGSTILIIAALCTGFFKSPQEKAEAELDHIAEAYYTEYLYPRLLGNLDNDPVKMLQPYAETGTAVYYLRQFLHYNNDEHSASAKYFEKMLCDTNTTGVRFIPKEPFGPRDFEMIYFWNCEKGDFKKE